MADRESILYSQCLLHDERSVFLNRSSPATGARTHSECHQSTRLVALLLVALAATAVVIPMFFLGNASGHDFQFHLASWMDAAGQWREGILYPRWTEWANWGFGEPRFVFYPPASWISGAALGSLFSWSVVPGLFIWLTLIASGMAMWKLTREWLPRPQAAMAAVLFAVNPYHLVLVYYRSDFAELLAGALLPLLLWAALRIARSEWRHVPALAMIFGGIWLSNVPAGIIATYSLVLFLVVGCILRRNFQPLFLGATAMIAGWGFAAFYILPAAWEQRWVEISQALTNNLYPSRNFIFTHSNDPEFLLFNWKVSSVALLMMLLTGIAAVFAARKRREFPDIWWMLIALASASVLLMFPPSGLLWQYLPRLSFVQFPWRWMEPLGLAFAFFIAAALDFSRKQRESWIAIATTLVVVAATGTLIARDAWWDDEDVPFVASSIGSRHGYGGTDEYAPMGCDHYELPGALPESDSTLDPGGELAAVPPNPRVALLDLQSGKSGPPVGVRIHTQRWSAEAKIFEADTPKPIVLAPRLLNYPAWEVRVDGTRIQPGAGAATAQMLVPLPPGEHRVEIRFRRTWDCVTGDAISFVSLVALLLGWFLRRRAPEFSG